MGGPGGLCISTIHGGRLKRVVTGIGILPCISDGNCWHLSPASMYRLGGISILSGILGV